MSNKTQFIFFSKPSTKVNTEMKKNKKTSIIITTDNCPMHMHKKQASLEKSPLRISEEARLSSQKSHKSVSPKL
jgi:prephenate dehydratase